MDLVKTVTRSLVIQLRPSDMLFKQAKTNPETSQGSVIEILSYHPK
jgi:hypothetical protein